MTISSRRWMLAVPLLCLALLVAGVLMLREPTEPAVPEAPTLRLLCGASLRPPIEELVSIFQRRHGVRIEVQYGASNLLLDQLELTETGDVFLPGDAFYIQEAARKGFMGELRTVAWLVPVIQVAEGNPKGIASVADLAKPGVRLAIADERAAAIGRITPELAEAAGLPRDAFRDNTVFTAVTGPELAQAVALGHVDATLIWRPVALQYPWTSVIEIPQEQNRKSSVDAAVLAISTQIDAAREFVRFLAGPAGRAAFERYQYDLP